jgi:hypothetical protein
MKAIKQDGTVWSGMRSLFLEDEMDFEIVFQASFNERDLDFLIWLK